MKSTLNLTGRIDIPRENVAARVVFEEGSVELIIDWDFSELDIPLDAQLLVDYWAAGTYETGRKYLGAISAVGSSSGPIDVSEMRNSDRIKLRLSATKNVNGLPMIVAQVDQIAATTIGSGQDPNSILKILPDADLAQPWQLQILEGSPVLVIKDESALYSYLKTQSPWFNPIVLPEVLGQIFDWFVRQDDTEGNRDIEVAEKWKQAFVALGADEEVLERMRSEDTDVSREEVENIRKSIVSSFVSRHGFFANLIELMNSTEEVQA